MYKTEDGATAKIRKEQVNPLGPDQLGNLTMGETNTRLSGKVEIGGRTFLIDSKADEDIWVQSIDCEVHYYLNKVRLQTQTSGQCLD